MAQLTTDAQAFDQKKAERNRVDALRKGKRFQVFNDRGSRWVVRDTELGRDIDWSTEWDWASLRANLLNGIGAR